MAIGPLAGSSDTAGAQANLEQAPRRADVHGAGPGVRREGEGRRQDDLRHPGVEPDPVRRRRSRTTSRGSAKLAGVKVTTWQNQGQPSQWVQGMNAAIAQKANAIVLLARQRPGRPAAADQGGEGEGDPDDRRAPLRREAASAPNVGGVVNIPYNVAGQLIADQAIVDTKGKANALVVTINQVQVDGADGGRDQDRVREVLQGLQPAVHRRDDRGHRDEDPAERPGARSRRDPGINYVICLYDSAEAPFASAAIRAAGRHRQGQDLDLQRHARDAQGGQEGRHHHDGRRREPRMDRLRDRRPVDADHGRPHSRSRASTCRCASSTARTSPRPASKFTQGWGNSYVGGYQKLWGLK